MLFTAKILRRLTYPSFLFRSCSEASDEIAAQRTKIRMPSWVMDGVRLTNEEYDEFVKLAAGIDNPVTGMSLRQALAKRMKTRLYKTGTDGQDGYKSDLIRQEVRWYRKQAKILFLERNEEVAAKIAELKRKRELALFGG